MCVRGRRLAQLPAPRRAKQSIESLRRSQDANGKDMPLCVTCIRHTLTKDAFCSFRLRLFVLTGGEAAMHCATHLFSSTQIRESEVFDIRSQVKRLPKHRGMG